MLVLVHFVLYLFERKRFCHSRCSRRPYQIMLCIVCNGILKNWNIDFYLNTKVFVLLAHLNAFYSNQYKINNQFVNTSENARAIWYEYKMAGTVLTNLYSMEIQRGFLDFSIYKKNRALIPSLAIYPGILDRKNISSSTSCISCKYVLSMPIR